jgi:hypothetical protein
MPAPITFNPMQTTNSQASFLLVSDGYFSGMVEDDPATRYQLEGGVVTSSATVPYYGGLPVSLAVPVANGATGQPTALGSIMTLAAQTAQSASNGIHGWTCFNQSHNGIITPSSGVPLFSSGMSLNFYRFGTNARIALPLSAGLANSLVSGAPTNPVSWDFVNQCITTYNAGVGALPVQIMKVSLTSKIVVYNPTTQAISFTPQGPCALVRI